MLNIFNGLSLLFGLLFIYYVYTNGIEKGLFKTIFIWCKFVVATPIPEAGLLVSMPLKNLLNIELDKTQIIVSIFSLAYIIYSYVYFKNYLNQYNLGRYIIKIIEFFEFSIFIVSILASISISYLINEIIDEILFKKGEIYHINNLYISIFSLFLIFYYFFILKKIISVN